MNKNKVFIGAVVVLGLSFFIALAYFNRRDEQAAVDQSPTIDSAILVKAHSPIKGRVDAPVTIVEFLDPECEACRAMQPIVNAMLDRYAGKVRVVIRYLPLHPNSAFASAALEELREAGKFDEGLDLFYARQPEWGSHADPRPELISKYLIELGIPKRNTGEDYLVAKHKTKIAEDLRDAKTLGLHQTPTFFVNGRLVFGVNYDSLNSAVMAALKAPSAEP